MSDIAVDSFWSDTSAPLPAERRIAFPIGRRNAELVVSIMPDQPVPDLATMSDTMVDAAIAHVTRGAKQTLTPQIVFATIRQGAHDAAAVATASGRELPVVQLHPRVAPIHEALTIEEQLQLAKVALPPAAVAPADCAVGFLYRDEILHFYPLLAVNLPEDIASYRDGSGTTTDLIQLLPFQA